MASAIDEDTARAVATGRETLGTVFSSAQANLQRVFLVFVVAFIGSFWALRVWIWDFLEATTEAEMGPEIVEATDIITRTPFEVILLQAKIGLIVGVVAVVPAVLYYARRPLRDRGFQSAVPITRGYAIGFATTSGLLFCLGVVYAYSVFFPFAFDFLATNAVNAGVKPSFGITEFTEFIALLTISFGLAAQLPLFMSVLSYTEIVPYETFRDKWRHAIVGITVFGALFSPPDPFTLIMWAMPLVVLYVFSLGLAKLITNIRRRGAAERDGTGAGRIKWRVLQFGLALVAVSLVSTVAIATGVLSAALDRLPGWLQSDGQTTLESIAAGYGPLGPALAGLTVAGGVGLLVLGIYTVRVLNRPVYPPVHAIRSGDADAVDLSILSSEDIEEVPPSVFESMDEEEMMDHAREALQADDREKAQTIIDRYDAVTAGEGAPRPETVEEEGGGVLAGTAAGVLDPFTEDETTEEDIGGYAYDIAFVVDSLTSRMFRIVAVFMLVLGGTFFWLYGGGLGFVLKQFLRRVPDDVLHAVAVRNGVDPAGMTLGELIAEMDIVIALHPVEVLIFEVKVSTIAAIVAVVPMVCYYAWPAMKERGLVRGDRRVFVIWGGALLGGFALGTYVGFFWVAPSVISYLVSDAITNGMVVSYRIKSFFWLVIFTTVGIGFLLNVVVTMALFHASGILSVRTMARFWRPIVVGIFVIAAFVSPRGVLTMLALALPVAATYLLGLALVWTATAGGRLLGGGGGGGLVGRVT